MERHKGTIISVSSDHAWAMVETDGTHVGYFVHHSSVIDHRVLHVDDRIEFSVAPNPRKPGWFHAVDAKYIGHVVVRQSSAALPAEAVRS